MKRLSAVIITIFFMQIPAIAYSSYIRLGSQSVNDVLNNYTFYYFIAGALLIIIALYIFGSSNRK